jgi:membrane protease YdiL (CAAX protease family)
MHILSFIIDVILAGYVVWEVVQFVPRYRQLKHAVANGDARARTRIYQRALWFEWISALLALVALGFDWSKLNPKSLALEGSSLIQSLPRGSDFDHGSLAGVGIGLAAGMVAMVIARIRSNRRGTLSPRVPDAPKPWWRELLPDFSALLPATTHERLFWAAVAVSAGICEEIVFRGWLLATLHGQLGLDGTRLILIGAAIFGLAHAYQGITGMILTAFAGAFFCVLYVETGSLLVPILLHTLVDLRFAFMPAPLAEKPHAAFA